MPGERSREGSVSLKTPAGNLFAQNKRGEEYVLYQQL